MGTRANQIGGVPRTLQALAIGLQAIPTVADIAQAPLVDGAVYALAGHSSPGDGGGGILVGAVGSVAPDDGGTVFAHPDGRFVRVYAGPAMARWFGMLPGAAAADNDAAFEAARAASLDVMIDAPRAGEATTYELNAEHDIVRDRSRVAGAPSVKLRFLDVGGLRVVGDAAPNTTIANVQVKDLEIAGTLTSRAFTVRGVNQSLFANLRINGAIDVGVQTQFAITNLFSQVHVTPAAAGGWVQQPIRGFMLGFRDPMGNEATYNNTFISCAAEGVAFNGIDMEPAASTVGNTWIGGASEGNAAQGIWTDTGCNSNRYYGLFMEGNGADIQDSAELNTYDVSASGQVWIRPGSANARLRGYNGTVVEFGGATPNIDCAYQAFVTVVPNVRPRMFGYDIPGNGYATASLPGGVTIGGGNRLIATTNFGASWPALSVAAGDFATLDIAFPGAKAGESVIAGLRGIDPPGGITVFAQCPADDVLRVTVKNETAGVWPPAPGADVYGTHFSTL